MFQLAVGENDELSQNAQLQLGQCHLRLNQKQPAQMAFEAASRDNFDPQVRETAMFNYALLAHETNFSVFSESIALFETFLREFPDSRYTDQVNDILAETFLTTKDYPAALNAINRIQNPGQRVLEPSRWSCSNWARRVHRLVTWARRYNISMSIGLGNYDAETRSNAYYWRGESYYRMGNYVNATNDFREFTRNATPNNENYRLGWYSLGYSLFKQQQYQQAISAFQQYTGKEGNRSKSEYADALNRIGDCHYFNRSFGEAERYYAQAADANPARLITPTNVPSSSSLQHTTEDRRWITSCSDTPTRPTLMMPCMKSVPSRCFTANKRPSRSCNS